MHAAKSRVPILAYSLLPNDDEGAWNACESGHPGVFEVRDGQMYLFFQGNRDKGESWYLSRVRVAWDEAGHPCLIRRPDGQTFRLK